jgi:chemotaxis protein CheX
MENKIFRLPDNLDLTAAAPLRAHLAALIGSPLDLDASAVQRVGGLSAQVLLAAAIAWKSQEHELRIVNPSQAFVEGMNMLGIPDLETWAEEHIAA